MKLITVPDTMRRLNISMATVHRLLAAGALSYLDIAAPGAERRKIRIVEASVDEFLAKAAEKAESYVAPKDREAGR